MQKVTVVNLLVLIARYICYLLTDNYNFLIQTCMKFKLRLFMCNFKYQLYRNKSLPASMKYMPCLT